MIVSMFSLWFDVIIAFLLLSPESIEFVKRNVLLIWKVCGYLFTSYYYCWHTISKLNAQKCNEFAVFTQNRRRYIRLKRSHLNSPIAIKKVLSSDSRIPKLKIFDWRKHEKDLLCRSTSSSNTTHVSTLPRYITEWTVLKANMPLHYTLYIRHMRWRSS